MVITYILGKSLYINLTNRCPNACAFCVRDKQDSVNGEDNLWLTREPSTEEIIEDIKKRNLKDFDMVVFCGFGEPFERFDDCRDVAKWIKNQDKTIKIRVNTNGQGSLIAKRNIAPEMEGLFDIVSISLNTDTAEKYDALCQSRYGLSAFSELIEFGKEAKKYVGEVIFSVVDKTITPEEIENCRKIAENCGVSFRVREYIE
ncbi:MAG: TatD family nuclease-associated radical SAM protein [Clostridia bacterium]|nr:TatD family nuclease-associated radical SAM protein [Clostridia bacterium]